MAVLSADNRLKAFLDLIAFSEGTSCSAVTRDDGYDIIVSGVDGAHRFDDYSAHPFADGRAPIIVRETATPLRSTASGRYQIILESWKSLAADLHLPDFSPKNQDRGALQLMRERAAANLVLQQQIGLAITRLCFVWASFPGNSYGQGGHTMDTLLDNYHRLLAAQTT